MSAFLPSFPPSFLNFFIVVLSLVFSFFSLFLFVYYLSSLIVQYCIPSFLPFISSFSHPSFLLVFLYLSCQMIQYYYIHISQTHIYGTLVKCLQCGELFASALIGQLLMDKWKCPHSQSVQSSKWPPTWQTSAC